MKAIGLTGGIGSGKSIIAKILKHLGYPVYISDTEASCLMSNHPDIRQEIMTAFGEDIYDRQYHINKSRLAKIIFEDPQALQTINGIVHPRVMEDFGQWSARQCSELVFFESAILFEAGLSHLFQAVICVTAPEDIRLSRVVARDQTTPDKVLSRMRNQADEQEKCRRADFIVYNDGQQMVVKQLLEIIKELKNQTLKRYVTS